MSQRPEPSPFDLIPVGIIVAAVIAIIRLPWRAGAPPKRGS